ncbi:MAG: NfeD family protein [Spirochaetota bacterium]
MEFWWIWIVVGVIFAIIEIFTPSFVSLAIGIASILTGLISLIPFVGAGLALQFTIFSVSMIGLIAVSRPIAKKLLGNNPKAITNVSAMIDKVGVVTIEIDNDKSQGYVKIGGEEWSARSIDNEIIKVGEKVIVKRIEGNKVIVSNKFSLSDDEDERNGNKAIGDNINIEDLEEPYSSYVNDTKKLSKSLLKQINQSENVDEELAEQIKESIYRYRDRVYYLTKRSQVLENTIKYFEDNDPNKNKEAIEKELQNENLDETARREYENALKTLEKQISSLHQLNNVRDTSKARLNNSLITLRTLQLDFLRLQYITDESTEDAIESLNKKTEEIDDYIDVLSDSLKDIQEL